MADCVLSKIKMSAFLILGTIFVGLKVANKILDERKKKRS